MVQPIPFKRASLTGKVRHRLSWWKKLILQVEISIEVSKHPGASGVVHRYLEWRDATFEDLQILEYQKQNRETANAFPQGPGLTA